MSDTEKKESPIPPKMRLDPNQKRAFYLTRLTIFFVVIALICFFYWLLIARFYENTEDAYVNGNIIPIVSQIDGIIITVNADDTQLVKEGQLLVALDPIDSQIAFEQAKADLATTVRDTHQYFLNNSVLKSSIIAHEATQKQASEDLSRRKKAIGSGAVSQEELNHAQDTLKSEEAVLAQAHAALIANYALTENTDLEHQPKVLVAAAKLRKAYIDYMRRIIRAPISGEISKRTAQVGQKITSGTQLMAVVPLEQVWVDANFKESQLIHMRVGQPVELTADIFGSSVKYHGKIMGFSAGTGSAFSLLPAQNATGNWIKVVQRLPVRIQLDPKELKDHPLRIGLSMDVTVNTHDRSGTFISEALKPPVYGTTIYQDLDKQSNEVIQKIITRNVGKTAFLNGPDKDKAPNPIKGSIR
ncbi:MAG: HlyD family efflux transporter periplasmic adaptor subunit [Legionellales bacterium]